MIGISSFCSATPNFNISLWHFCDSLLDWTLPVSSWPNSTYKMLINPYWQISGAWARSIYGKLIQNRAFLFYSKNFGAWHRPISGKFIQIWTSFPEIRLTHAPIFSKNWIGANKKLMDEFSRNRFSSCPGNWNLGKISWWVFQDLPIRVKIFTEGPYFEILQRWWWGTISSHVNPSKAD